MVYFKVLLLLAEYNKIAMPPSFIVSVNDVEFELDAANASQLDWVNETPNSYHLLHDRQSYKIVVDTIDLNNKQIELEVNGTKYSVSIADAYDQLVQQMGLTTEHTQKVKEIRAPMPGLVLDIPIEIGQAVEKGATLLVLEAMKMENALQALGEGIVKTINVQKGQAVEKNQLLVEFE